MKKMPIKAVLDNNYNATGGLSCVPGSMPLSKGQSDSKANPT
jgi:hypothetical protein